MKRKDIVKVIDDAGHIMGCLVGAKKVLLTDGMSPLDGISEEEIRAMQTGMGGCIYLLESNENIKPMSFVENMFATHKSLKQKVSDTGETVQNIDKHDEKAQSEEVGSSHEKETTAMRAEAISTIDALGVLLVKFDRNAIKDPDTQEVIAEVDEEVLVGMMIGAIYCKMLLTGGATETDPELILDKMTFTHAKVMRMKRLKNLFDKIKAAQGDIEPQSDDE